MSVYQGLGYAESVDGILWVKPSLHLVDLSAWHDDEGRMKAEIATRDGLWVSISVTDLDPTDLSLGW